MAIPSTELVFNTLQLHDPERTTVTLGSAAISVLLTEAGEPDVVRPADVDTLCSEAFFADCNEGGVYLPEGYDLQVRTTGRPPIKVLPSPVLDIYPPEKASDVLPFSASRSLGGTWRPISYENCLDNRPETIGWRGYRIAPMAELLLSIAVTGRDKDLPKVSRVLPIARTLGLVSREEHDHVADEYKMSASLRARYPFRYYARGTNPSTAGPGNGKWFPA